jgi:hypothetical protein
MPGSLHEPVAPRARTIARACACVLFAAAVIAAAPAHASTYDHLNVISYETWRGSASMNAADIQAFLETQSGPLKSYVCTDTITSATPAKRSAASIIWRSAQAWNLNPRVILATLQKEQSLITTSNSSNATRIKKAMGCGVYSGSSNTYPGFANQVFNGARKLSTYEITYHWVPGMTKTVTAYKDVDATHTVNGQVVHYQKRVSYKKTITPVNAATFALYTYTPYYESSFHDVYVRYFGDPQAPPRLRPVYRFRNRSNGTYYYTASEAKRYTLMRTASRTWSYSGVSFTVDTSATANTFPVYEMYNTLTHKYLYTAAASSRDRLLKVRPRQWRFLRVVAHVSHDSSGTAPVYRLRDKKTHADILTASSSVKRSLTTGRSATFAYAGVAFYLDALETTSTPVGPAS